MKTKIILASAASVAVLGTGIYVMNASATNENRGGFGVNYSSERHEQMEKALESNNYGEWKKLMGDRGPGRVVTEQNFHRFVEMHKLREEGKFLEADKIRQELGMGQKQGKGKGNCDGSESGQRRHNFQGNQR